MQLHRPLPLHARGFTLIEILMVVLLIGIIAGIVVFYVDPSSPERSVDTEMDRLMSVISLASEEAVEENHELGLKIQDKGYGFLIFDENKQAWMPYAADDAFKVHQLPDELLLQVLRQSQTKLPRNPKAQDANRLEPDILFLSSGESTNSTLQISVPAKPAIYQRLEIDDMGGLKREDKTGG